MVVVKLYIFGNPLLEVPSNQAEHLSKCIAIYNTKYKYHSIVAAQCLLESLPVYVHGMCIQHIISLLALRCCHKAWILKQRPLGGDRIFIIFLNWVYPSLSDYQQSHLESRNCLMALLYEVLTLKIQTKYDNSDLKANSTKKKRKPKLLGYQHSSEHLLCSTEERKWHRFGTTWIMTQY